jgi:four helix bundle protein
MTKLEIRNSKFVGTSSPGKSQVRDFTDLQVWQLARDLRKLVYGLIRNFPNDEKFALSAQLRRAAVSITANIAESFGRYSFQENIQFCRLARGSAFEVRDHLIISLDQGYLTAEQYRDADSLSQYVIQTLNGYVRSTKARQAEKAQQKVLR